MKRFNTILVVLLFYFPTKAQVNTDKILYQTDEEAGEINIPSLPGRLCISNCPTDDFYNNVNYQYDYYRVNTAIGEHLWGCKESSRGGCAPIENVYAGDYDETRFVFSPLEKGIFTMEERRKVEEWNGNIRFGIDKVVVSDETIASFEIRVMDFSWNIGLEDISGHCYGQENIIDLYDYLSDDFATTENVVFYIGDLPLTNPKAFPMSTLSLGTNTLKAVGTFDNGTREISYELMVQEVPAFDLDLPEKACKGGGDIDLFGFVPNKTGTFDSRPSVEIVNGVFSVSSVDPAIYEISYTVENELGCQRTVTSIVEVPEEADLDFDLPMAICQDEGEINLLDYTNIKTGKFTFDNGLTVSPLWDVAKASDKDYTISYTIENEAGCLQTVTKTIGVSASPAMPSFTLPTNVCQNATPLDLYDLVAPKTGTFSSESPNFRTSPFDPSKMNLGSHTITYIVENERGCQGVTSKEIEIGAELSVDAGADQTVCPSSPIIELTGLPTGGIWSGIGVNGNQFLGTGLAEGVYELVYTYENEGCSQSDQLSITVINELPMDFTADRTDIGQGEMVTFTTSTQAEKYLWKIESNSFDYEGRSPSIYFYADHNEAEKYFDVTLIITIGNCTWELKKEGYIYLQKEASDGFITSIDKLQAENTITIYPNPFVEQLLIDLPNGNRYEVALYDFAGQLAYQLTISKTGILDLSLLSAGLYMLKVQGDDIVKTFKIQKK